MQDKFQIRSNLSLTAGLRFDDHGGLTEKYGRLYNFDPSPYDYDAATDTIVSNGFIIAGNNKLFPTKGVSDSTLTGRQWGFAPRLGVAWSPKKFNNKIVVRAGWGMYYDRGELFTYLSPGVAAGVIPGGPFGVNQSPPFVNSQVCTAIGTFYEGFIPTCDPTKAEWRLRLTILGERPSVPLPPAIPPRITPAERGGHRRRVAVVFFRGLQPEQQAPLHSQPDPWIFSGSRATTLSIEIGYVGNSGRHEVIPIPFNQAQIATPSHPIHGQNYTYGYTVEAPRDAIPLKSGVHCLIPTRVITSTRLVVSDGSCPMARRCWQTTKAATWTFVFPTSAIRRSLSPTPPRASRPTTRCRPTSKNV